MLSRRTLISTMASIAMPVRAAGKAMPTVVFISPGTANPAPFGPLARAAADYMALAAQQLGVDLEVQYANDSHLRMIELAELLAARTRRPDYVVIVNDKMAGPAMLQALAGTSIRAFVIHSNITDEQRLLIGNEREKLTNWIGSATPDNARGVFRELAALHQALNMSPIRALGITGPPSTPVSLDRAKGLQDYLDSVPGSRLEQLTFGNWSEADGEEKARVLLARYPECNLIWAANDDMAIGARSASTQRLLRPVVGGVGGLPRALRCVADGSLTASLAGQHLIGVWALVMLYDHANGIDFIADGGTRRTLDFLYVVTRANLASFERAFNENGRPLDFRRYSKVHRPTLTQYDFSIAPLLAGLG